MKKHQKHSKLTKPKIGNYSRNEFAILGAPCSLIQKLATKIGTTLAPEFTTAYIDEKHSDNEEDIVLPFEYTIEKRGSALSLLSKNGLSEHTFKSQLEAVDVALINGNHFEAQQQIVLVHSDKLDSLERKLDRLTNVVAIILFDGVEFPKFLIPFKEQAKCFNWNEQDLLIDIVRQHIVVAPLYTLILTGGKSTRMGFDKSSIDYHGEPQLDYLKRISKQYSEQVFISVKSDKESIQNFEIPDTFIGLGAYGGILSAFQKHPNVAWLVIAIDMPNIDHAAIEQLITARNTAKVATAFLNKATEFPDPLFTIFEPRAYSKLLSYLALGYSCPRKVLINEDIQLVHPADQKLLLNINTQEEKDNFLNDH